MSFRQDDVTPHASAHGRLDHDLTDDENSESFERAGTVTTVGGAGMADIWDEAAEFAD